MIFLPPLLAWSILLAISQPWKRDGRPRNGASAGALALGASCLAAHWVALGWPPLPPVQHRDWLPHLTLAAMALGLFDAFGPWPGALRWGLRLALLIGLPLLLLRSRFQNVWPGSESFGWLAGLVLGGLVLWVPLEALGKRPLAITLPLTLLLLSAGVSLAVLFSGSILLFQLGANLTVSLLAVPVVAGWRSRRSPSVGALPVTVIFLLAIGLSGSFYSEVPVACVLLLLSTPAVVFLADWVGGGRLNAWKTIALDILAALIPATLAVVLAYRAAPPGEL